MITRFSKEADIPALRRLWKQAFGDSDTFLDHFFAGPYQPDHCVCGWEDGKIVAMVYWFDYSWREHTIAYGYAVAVDEEYRHRGLCHKLLESLRKRLRDRGYYGILLVPEDLDLARFYGSMGYRVAMKMEHFTVPAAGDPDPGLRKISWQLYEKYRPQLLPEEAIFPGQEIYQFLDTYMDFYICDAGLFCGYVEETEGEKILHMEEFLGDPRGVFQVIQAMGCQKGVFRLQGGYAYGMFRNLTKDTAMPKYHGLPMG